MSGSGVVYVVNNVNDKDDTPVWLLILEDGPGNEKARATLWTNATVRAMFEPHVAVMMLQRKYPTCPIVKGDTISWDAGHIYCGGKRYDKHWFEVDPDAPLSPP